MVFTKSTKMASNKKLFSNLKENASVVIDNHLDSIEIRIEKLEKKERWRDILALIQEYKEWGQTEQGEDYNMMWMEDLNNYKHKLRGVVQPKFYVKLDFEIAVDQKGGTHDQTFEGVPNSQCRILRAGWPRPILAQKYQIRHTRSKPSKWVLYL